MPDMWLTTAETAARLRVKPQTVYAYVSRGLLPRHRAATGRGSRFARADVERLAIGGGRAAVAGDGAIERIRTELTLLVDDELYLRGHRAADLAARQTPESVATLLWTGRLDPTARFTAPAALRAAARAATATLPATAPAADRVRLAVIAAAAADPLRHDLAREVIITRAAHLIAIMVDAAGTDSTRSDPTPIDTAPDAAPAELTVRLAPALRRDPATPSDGAPHEIDLLRAALVLLADHDLAISTLAARVAASAGAHPYAVCMAGLGAMDGLLHGAASTTAHRFLTEATVDPVAALGERLRSGATLPGFGHRVYRHHDPRAEFLLARLRGADAPIMTVVDELIARVAGRPHGFPNVDLALAALGHHLGWRADAGEVVFAIARTPGWIAHALEEYREPGLRFRVEGVYVGPNPTDRG